MNDSLLTTREAARFLRVSEASIRRWADGGLLPVSRVGRRRARRFREADLLRFMQPKGAGGPAAGVRTPASGVRTPASGAVVLQEMVLPLGSHLVSFYNNDSGRQRLALRFLRDGLLAGQPCMLYATPAVRQEYLHALTRQNIDVDGAIRTGLLALLPIRACSAEEWIIEFERRFTEVSRRHPGPVRFLGEAVAGLKSVKSVTELLALERQLTALVKRLPMVMLCPYDVRSFDGSTVLETLKLHFDTFDHQLAYFLS